MGFISSVVQRLYDATKRHYLERQYGAPWPFPYEAGVGLHIVATNLNPHLFMEEIVGAGCMSEVAARLSANLSRDGEIKTTVSNNIDLLTAIDGMQKAGAVVTVIPPAQHYLEGLKHGSQQEHAGQRNPL